MAHRLVALAAAAAVHLLPAPAPAAAPAPTTPAAGCARVATTGDRVVLDFAFCGRKEGWRGGFADLPPEGRDDPAYDLVFELADLPDSAGVPGQGLRLAGTNRSDDLFMFAARRVEGLRPSTRYAARFTVSFATNAGRGCVGIGGAPGESVFVKAGAGPSGRRTTERDGTLRLNYDIGAQSQRGRDAVVLGDVAAAGVGCDGERYAIKTLSSRGEPFFPITSPRGVLWLIVGFDSGYEGRSDLYLRRIRVELTPVRR